MTNIYGYIRVSTKEQNADRQIIAMNKLHIQKKNLFIDKQSGKDFARPQYLKLLQKLKKTTCSTSKALIVWDATIQKFWNNGEF